MRKILSGFAILCAFILTSILTACNGIDSLLPSSLGSCDLNRENNPPPANLLRENWLCELNLDPNIWVKCADPWFLTGKPNALECVNLNSALNQDVTRIIHRIPDYVNDIKVDGGFQVQIVGGEDHNSLSILGPITSARHIGIDVYKRTLSVFEKKSTTRHSPTDPDSSAAPIIVRIGVKNLHFITNCGCGHVFGRNILSNGLVINSTGRGNILLAGNMNIMKVIQTGSGSVIVYGANTPNLSINALGSGNVNLTGRVGVQCIINRGCGTVRILGADTDDLVIHATGSTRTSVVGYANVRMVDASEFARVYLYWVNACNTSVRLCDYARVGLAGVTQHLNVDVRKYSRFWGGYLHADTVYVKTSGNAHANVYTERQIFADALGSSSIYYNGRPVDISKFYSTHGNVLPILSNASCAPPCALPVGRPRCATGLCRKECD